MARLSDKDWRSVLDLSGAAADLPVHQRLAFLQSAAASPEIAREVLELLAADNADESSEPVSFASPGMRIGRFVIEGCLGRGGMGEVYSARDTDLGRKVALKFLREGTIGSRGSEQNFIREAKTASALNHPNIVTIHELIRQESAFAIVMEWVDGIPLRRFCENPCSSQQTIDIGRQIALALAAAHGVGVVHRDIKPENILVRPDGHVKVLDFGLARRFQGNEVRSVASMPAGTLRYMSPEQARNQPVTAASDLFSFGLVLYELASGRHPFSRPSPLETAHAILTADPEELPASLGIPAPLRDLIGSLLSKDPAARPTAAEAARQLVKDPPPPKNGDRRGELWARYRLPAMVLGAILGAVAIAALLTPDIRGREDFRSLKVQPLTSQSGWESAPAISPDGQSIAFTWSEKLDRPRQIYLKRPNDKDPVKLTNSETGNILYLVWSPDGSRIAFKRQFEKAGAIYTISSAGTDEQKIVDLTNANLSSSVDWSPDGSQLAFADDLPGMDRMALYLYTLQTGEKRKLTSPPAGYWGDWNPRYSPDGRTVAFKRVTGFWADDLYVVPASGGDVKRLTTLGRGIWGHAWTPDGKNLILSCQRSGTVFGIWQFPLEHPSQLEPIRQGGIDSIMPVTSRKTGRLAWVDQLWDLNIYRAPLAGGGKPLKLISSTLRDQDAVYAPDGRIAWISDRSGSREIWISRGDGSGQTQITNFAGPQIDHLQWSPDGSRLAFDSRPNGQADIFLLACDPVAMRCGQPARVATGSPAESPSWSADGKLLYFASHRTGRAEIWRQAVSGGPPVQVSRHGGYVSHESPDGQWLYFTRIGGDSIWRVTVQPPFREELVVGPPFKVQTEGWAVTADEAVFIDRPSDKGPAAIRAYGLVSKRSRTVMDLTEVFPDRGDITVSVSPDARWILYSQLDRSGSNVFVAESGR